MMLNVCTILIICLKQDCLKLLVNIRFRKINAVVLKLILTTCMVSLYLRFLFWNWLLNAENGKCAQCYQIHSFKFVILLMKILIDSFNNLSKSIRPTCTHSPMSIHHGDINFQRDRNLKTEKHPNLVSLQKNQICILGRRVVYILPELLFINFSILLLIHAHIWHFTTDFKTFRH